MSNDLRSFLTLPYEELEELNLKAKEQRKNRVPQDQIREERLKYLTDEQASADRCPRLLGSLIKIPEIQFHHDVYNQFLWNQF